MGNLMSINQEYINELVNETLKFFLKNMICMS